MIKEISNNAYVHNKKSEIIYTNNTIYVAYYFLYDN